MQRLSANWKWLLTIAVPIVFAIFVFLPVHPRVRAASGNSADDDIVPISYDVPDQAKPSPFTIIQVKRYHPAPVAPAPDPEQ